MAATASACEGALFTIIADEAVLTVVSFLLGYLLLPRFLAWRSTRSKAAALEAPDSESDAEEECGSEADVAAVARQLRELRREVAAEAAVAAKAIAVPLATTSDASSVGSKGC